MTEELNRRWYEANTGHVITDPMVEARTLWLETHPLPTGPDHLLPSPANTPDRTKAKRPRLAGGRQNNGKTNLVAGSVPDVS